MPNNNTSPLNIPLREPGGDADFESRLRAPFLHEVFGRGADGQGHGFKAGDEDAVCEGLRGNELVNVSNAR